MTQPLHTETSNLARTDLLMNPDRMLKTRPVRPTLRVKTSRRKSQLSLSQPMHGMLVALVLILSITDLGCTRTLKDPAYVQ